MLQIHGSKTCLVPRGVGVDPVEPKSTTPRPPLANPLPNEGLKLYPIPLLSLLPAEGSSSYENYFGEVKRHSYILITQFGCNMVFTPLQSKR